MDDDDHHHHHKPWIMASIYTKHALNYCPRRKLGYTCLGVSPSPSLLPSNKNLKLAGGIPCNVIYMHTGTI